MPGEYDYSSAGPRWYTVTISKPGPRGGKRPAYIDIRLRAHSYDEAVERAEDKLLARCDITVSY